MRELLLKSVEDSIQVVSQLKQPHALTFMESAAKALADCFLKGNKVLIAGNGGSLCDGAHFAEELTGIFRTRRPALPAISLSDPGHLTCVGNDLGFEHVFSRAVEAYGQSRDIFIGLTTSGKSINLIKAFEMAQQKEMHTIAFLGRGGGSIKGMCDLELVIDGFATSDRIQEAHMAAIHIIIELIEHQLFFSSAAKAEECTLAAK